MISVIVPVYKVEEYIHRCIDSILAQTFTDFELILVDDGSPDNCGKICDEYALIDNRVHVIHKENGGLSDARNAGIDWVFLHSNSEWLTFIDSDDWIHIMYLKALLVGAQKTESSIVIGAFQQTTGELPVVNVDNLKANLIETEKLFCEKHINAVVAWGKLYAKKLFNAKRFPIGKLHEDEYITYKLLFQQKKIAFIDEPIYAYYVNPKSITGQSWSQKRMDRIQAYMEQLEFFKNNGMDHAWKYVQWSFIRDLAIGINHLYGIDKKEYVIRKRQLRSAIRKYIKYQSYNDKDLRMIYSAAYPNEAKIKYVVKKKFQSVRELFATNKPHK